jgi:hypothetical protein
MTDDLNWEAPSTGWDDLAWGDDDESNHDWEGGFTSKSWFMEPIKEKFPPVAYKYAKKWAEEVDLTKRSFHFLDGKFIFGDALEALFVARQMQTDHLQIATLSMSQENADSLRNLITAGYVKKITLCLSTVFYAHERGKSGLVPYLYEQFKGDELQICVSRTHAKMIQFRTKGGKPVSIHGSANLRTSGNIEQICIDADESTFEALNYYFDLMRKEYATIDLNKKTNLGE